MKIQKVVVSPVYKVEFTEKEFNELLQLLGSLTGANIMSYGADADTINTIWSVMDDEA